jgi:hypothetical protein
MDDPASVREPVFVDIARLPNGGWIVAEAGSDLIEYSPDGQFLGFWGERGEGPGELLSPTRVVLDASDSLWVSDDRGRVVVFDPAGRPTRTILSPDLYRINGFTPSGLPFTVLTRDSGRDTPEPLLFEFVQVWDREGEGMYALGPGEFDSGARGRVVMPLSPPQVLPLTDSTFLVPGSWRAWVHRWTRTREEPLTGADAAWSRLGLEGLPTLPEDNEPISITTAGDGGAWVIAAIRRMARDREEKLVDPGPNAPRFPFRRFSPAVRNEVFDGALIHVSGTGDVTEGVVFDEYPWGFVDPDRFFTFRTTEEGLIQLRVWRYRLTCAGAPSNKE